MKFSSTVIDSIKRAEDVQSIRFQKPVDFGYNPGQFMFLTINHHEEKLVKHFTISSSPTENFLEITKKITGHSYSNAFIGLKKGDKVSIDGPYGDFSYIGKPEKVLFLTGGIGITPVRSIIRYCIDVNIEADIVLLYSCKDETSILFKDELNDIAKTHHTLSIFYTVTRQKEGWNGIKGRIDGDMIKELVPDFASRDLYICGPVGMVDNLGAVIKNELNISSTQIHKEKFLGL